MPAEGATFYFQAGTPSGEVFAGELQADSKEQALAQLKLSGFRPLRVDKRPIRDTWLHREVSLGLDRSLNAAECEAVCRELALLLRSGLQASEALETMVGSKTRQPRRHRFATALRHGIMLGRTLSEGVEASGYRLPPDLVPVLKAGEASGNVPQALEMLAASYGEANGFRRMVISAVAYPILLLAVSAIVLALIAFFVAPSLAELFVSMDREVPWSLSVLVAGADFVAEHAFTLVVLVVLGAALVVATGSLPSLRRKLAAGLGFVPVVGNAMQWAAGRRLVSTLRLYLASNVPLAMALPSAIDAADFPTGDSPTAELVARIRSGSALAPALRQSRLLPDNLVHLIEVGERSGRLVEVLGLVAETAKQRVEQRMALATSLLAPALVLLVGSLIGVVIFSVFSALLEINEVAL